jgi:3-hydroxybutyryl-CoA dehydrogenase
LSSHNLPSEIDARPIVVLGAGTLGSRIALMFAAGGSPVRIHNRSLDRAYAAQRFVEQQIDGVRETLDLNAAPAGTVEVVPSLEEAIPGGWLIIESLAEDLELKRRVFADMDRLADHDAILATNSSSYPSSEVIDAVERPERVLNLHFLMPPQVNPVELMSCGRTDPAIVDTLMARLPRYGLTPYEVRCESIGFIFNRIWAAIKRESLMAVADGAATPEDIDRIWAEVFRSPVTPFRMMDQVGLDVVLDIEEHYASSREGIPEGPRALLREKLELGHRGVKSGRGFYDDYPEEARST